MVRSSERASDTAVSPEDELRRCRVEMEETRQRLEDLISTASDVIWETDAELRIVRRYDPRNPEGAADRDSIHFLGKSSFEIDSGDPAHDPILAAHHEDLRQRRPFRGFVHRIVRQDGSVAWRESNGRPFFGKNGEFLGYRGTAKDITQRKKDEERIAHLAHHDSLTGLPNRRSFLRSLEQTLDRMDSARPPAILLLDLDRFKMVNDTLGHAAGDALLCAVSTRLAASLAECGMAARLGGDEFAVLVPVMQGRQEAEVLARRIIDAAGQPYLIEGHRIAAKVTIGIAVASADNADAGTLLRNADIALYNAKADEPGTFRFFEREMAQALESRRLLESELRMALVNDEFELFYQPFYDARSGELSAFEALLRWRHPVRGLVYPDQFIPILEETGLIVPVGEWVLREACTEATNWPEHIHVSVNLSPVQFRNRTPVGAVIGALSLSGLPPERLELEITESVLILRTNETIDALHELRSAGVKISLDDFGTGYSSLSYLRDFPFDKIKIDRSFIRDLELGSPAQRRGGIAIIRAIAALGTSLQLATIAEGVETRGQFEIVRAEGCTEVQGYLFSRPVPADQLPELLKKSKSHPSDWESSLYNLAVHRAGPVDASVPGSESAPESFFVDVPRNGDVLYGESI